MNGAGFLGLPHLVQRPRTSRMPNQCYLFSCPGSPYNSGIPALRSRPSE